MTCGHLDILSEQDIESIARDVLYEKIHEDAAELRFRELLDEVSENVRVVKLRNPYQQVGIQKLFFVDGTTFERYLTNNNAALLKPDEQADLLLLTPLPNDPRELDTELDRFWDRWVN